MLAFVSGPVLSESELAVNKKLAKNLSKWIREKKFCIDYPDIGAIAVDLDVSVEQLNYFCRTELGEKFFSWRKVLRMRYASVLLCMDMKTPASKIGRMVGVNDSSDFRRQFKEVFKMTPEQWRKSED